MPKIDKSLDGLDPSFRKKLELFLAEVYKIRKDVKIFEARRSYERQCALACQGRTVKEAVAMGVVKSVAEKYCRKGKKVTWTLQSAHLSGKAVDLVFYDDVSTPQYENKPMRKGPYDKLIEIAKNYGIKSLAPTETCHFEDINLTIDPKIVSLIKSLKDRNSTLWKAVDTSDNKRLKENIQSITHTANEALDKIV